MQYFEHDSKASTDQKIMSLRVACGSAGVDTYWYLIEQMHKDERGLCKDDARAMRAHCHILCLAENEFSAIVEEIVCIDLMYVDDDGFLWSERAKENIDAYRKKSETSRSNANKRWGNKDGNAKGMQPHSKSNANPMLTKQNKTKVSTAKRSTKPLASSVAAVADATPLAAGLPHCPDCDGLMAFDPLGGFWRCRDTECRATMKPADIDKGTPHCPLCKSIAEEISGKWKCPICGDIKAPDFGGAK